MHSALLETGHRPWPLPAKAWTWRQQWIDLAFLHWPVEAALIEPRLPPGLRLQTFDGVAWVGVVPFRMAGVMRRPFPDLPGISAFPELNVRTYVETDGKPGVWFLSLDAANALAVWGGRVMFNLPYFNARMRLEERDGWIHYKSVRADEPTAEFCARYRAVSNPYSSKPGSFDHWLTERYCLYSFGRRNGLQRVDVHHHQWPLCIGEVEVETNTMLDVHGLKPLRSEPVCHFARHIDVVVFPSEQVMT